MATEGEALASAEGELGEEKCVPGLVLDGVGGSGGAAWEAFFLEVDAETSEDGVPECR